MCQARKLDLLSSREAVESYYRVTLTAEPDLHLRLLQPEIVHNYLAREVLQTFWQDAKTWAFAIVNRWLRSDVHFVLPYNVLHKVDTASMRYGLEVRIPLVV